MKFNSLFLYNYTKSNNLTLFRNNNMSLFHSSSIIYSSSEVDVIDLINNSDNNIKSLELIKYSENVVESDIPEIMEPVSSYSECFPWLLDENGKQIDYNKSVDVFKAVKMISLYLEKRYDLSKEDIAEVKISELLKPFQENNNVTIFELFNHFGNLYNKDKSILVKTMASESSENSLNELNLPSFNRKPLGELGEISVNQVATNMLELNWELMLKGTKLTVHAIPTVFNLVSYSFIMRGYMKYVHNRPYDKNISPIKLEKLRSARIRHLTIFSFIGAPLVLWTIRNSAIGINNMISVSPNFESMGFNTVNSSILLFLSKINKKIPSWIKLLFKLLLLTVLILKLLGYNLGVLNDMSFLKNFLYVSSSLVICYQILQLYLIHIFSSRKVTIPQILPDFVINWLKDIEILSSTPESLREFKKTCYIEISLYLTIIIFITIY